MENKLDYVLREIRLHKFYLRDYLGIVHPAEINKMLEIYIKTFWPEYFNKFFS